MLLGWKEINRREKDGRRFVFFVFDKKCIVVWTQLCGDVPIVLFPFYNHEDFEEGFKHPSTLG